jgi:hypothetical protein
MTTDRYKCPSYYDDNNILRDCTCGKCGTIREQVGIETNRLVADFQRGIPVRFDLFVDAIVKLHEAEVERIVGDDADDSYTVVEPFDIKPVVKAGEIHHYQKYAPLVQKSRSQLRREQYQRAAITPKGGKPDHV